jgi:hypothetical protein
MQSRKHVEEGMSDSPSATSGTTRIVDELIELKKKAYAGPVGKRVSSFMLYEVLQRCAMAVERMAREPEQRAEVEAMIVARPNPGRNRTFVEKSSDDYVVVCRFVFPSEESYGKERSNASRYAACLRQMALQGIKPDEVAHKLRTTGGVNRYYLTRPVERLTVRTKTLYLTTQIEIPKNGEFMLVLRRLEDGRLEVCSQGE